MKIAAGSDHAGIHLKRAVMDHLESLGHTVEDLGTHDSSSCDYPDFARAVGSAVSSGQADWGLLICGTGQGMAMTANKVRGVRAAVALDTFSSRMARLHNDANVLCMGERVVGQGLACDIVDSWLAAEFEGGRHQRRVNKINALDQGRQIP